MIDESVWALLTKNTHVPATIALGLQDDVFQGLVEEGKQPILQVYIHAQDPVQKLTDVVVLWIQMMETISWTDNTCYDIDTNTTVQTQH